MAYFNVGDRVRIGTEKQLYEFSYKERELLKGKPGVITAIEGRYLEVHLDEDIPRLSVNNDLLMLPSELVRA